MIVQMPDPTQEGFEEDSTSHYAYVLKAIPYDKGLGYAMLGMLGVFVLIGLVVVATDRYNPSVYALCAFQGCSKFTAGRVVSKLYLCQFYYISHVPAKRSGTRNLGYFVNNQLVLEWQCSVGC